MNHKIIAVALFSFLALTSAAYSQTGYTPSVSGGTQYPSSGQMVNPSATGNGYNGTSGTPRVPIPTVPNSGYVPGQSAVNPDNRVNPAPTQPQRQVIPNPQNGSYTPQPSFGQPQPVRQPQSLGQPQPVGAQPNIQPRSNAPFELTPQQQEQVNNVLNFWENYTKGIKKFEADFDLYSYPAVSVGGTDVNSAPKAQQTTGFLKYEAPNKGIFRVDGPPKELYRCNGKSVYTYNFDKKEINEYKYSDGAVTAQELKKGPMAFLFGASAATLRDRYWIRLLPLPPGAPQGQIWLEAYPKYQEDLQDMTKAELIINVKPCKPVAFQRYSPNGDRQSYALKNIKVNKFELFGGEPFEPNERGWTVITSSQPE